MILSSVDFPDPDAPTIETYSPIEIDSDTSSSAEIERRPAV
jgi:hypothetical protein